MRVPSLSCGNVEFSDSYRLIAIHALEGPLAVVATLENSVWAARGVRFSNTDLTTTIDTMRTLSKDEAIALGQIIRESRFWEGPFSEAYRLIAVGLDNPSPVAISATLNQETWSLRAVRFRNRADLIPTIDQTRTLSADEGQMLA